MSTKEMAHSIVDILSEEKLRELISIFADENTIARLETEIMASDPEAKRFYSVEELFEDLNS